MKDDEIQHLGDDELLELARDANRRSRTADDRMDRFAAFNEWHDLRREALNRGLREEIDGIIAEFTGGGDP